jgi:hypothetical protein
MARTGQADTGSVLNDFVIYNLLFGGLLLMSHFHVVFLDDDGSLYLVIQMS